MINAVLVNSFIADDPIANLTDVAGFLLFGRFLTCKIRQLAHRSKQKNYCVFDCAQKEHVHSRKVLDTFHNVAVRNLDSQLLVVLIFPSTIYSI